MNRMARNIKIAATVCILLAGAAWFLLQPFSPEVVMENSAGNLLVDKSWQEVQEIKVANENGIYVIRKQENGSYLVHDIPEFAVNMEYVAMLLDECSQISYEEVVETGMEYLEAYGLNNPVSTIDITYEDGSLMQLFLGIEEPISQNRYAMAAGSDQIILLRGSRCVRFLMPVEKYIDFIIIEPNVSTDILRSLGDVTFGGSRFQEPVVLKEVTAQSDKELLRQAVSFGAVTHIISEPVVHEADSTELTALADSLMGLISVGVVAYNCSDDIMAEYGFNDPILTVKFDYKNHQNNKPENILLKLSQLENGTYIVTRNKEGIIYKIADVNFTEITYDRLVLRWFLTPLLTDVKILEIKYGGQLYRLETCGAKPKELSVTLDGRELDSDLYRKFYNLVVSGAADEGIIKDVIELSYEPLMEIRFIYEDELKPADVMRLYEGPLRKHYVEVNGVCEYTIRAKYLAVVAEALQALIKGSDFSQEW